MYVKIKLTDEPSWPMCILDLSKQPAKGTAQNTERLNVNGAACSSIYYDGLDSHCGLNCRIVDFQNLHLTKRFALN